MAYLTHARSNPTLISSLLNHKLITSLPVKEAMLAVDRGNFLPGDLVGEKEKARAGAYEDSPQGIGFAATISAPHMHAMALEWLGGSESGGEMGKGSFLKGKRVLDVGSGSGYLTACLAEMVFHPPASNDGINNNSTTQESTSQGKVIAIEHIRELRDMGFHNMRKTARGKSLIEEGKVEFVVGDGREGWIDYSNPDEGYDAIHVGAAALTVHDALINQLRSPGRIFIPVQSPHNTNQHIWIIDKDIHGSVTRKKLCGVNYVPLTDAPNVA